MYQTQELVTRLKETSSEALGLGFPAWYEQFIKVPSIFPTSSPCNSAELSWPLGFCCSCEQLAGADSRGQGLEVYRVSEVPEECQGLLKKRTASSEGEGSGGSWMHLSLAGL